MKIKIVEEIDMGDGTVKIIFDMKKKTMRKLAGFAIKQVMLELAEKQRKLERTFTDE